MAEDIDTKFYRAAVALAEELNFSRAADRLHLTQSALTKQIQTLEEFLGYALFERDSRSVSVTLAGETFVEEARFVLLHQERAIQLSRSKNRDHEIVLHVGKSPYTDPYLLTNLLSLRLPLFPNLRVELTTKLSNDLAHDLLNGKLDLAFLTGVPPTPKIISITVSKQPFFVAMLDDDILASSREIRGTQLEATSCILFERHVNPVLYDAVRRTVRPASKPGTSIHHVMTAEDASHFVRRGLGVAVLTRAGAWRIARNGITIRPLIADGLLIEICLACRSDSKTRIVGDFLRTFVRGVNDARVTQQLPLGLAG